MKMRLLVLVGSLALGIPTYGQAHKTTDLGWIFKDGNHLLRQCDPTSFAPPDYFTPDGKPLYKFDEAYRQNQSECRAYIMGVSDLSTALSIPNGTEADQLKDIVVAYLTAHPETRQKSAASLIVLALSKFYAVKP